MAEPCNFGSSGRQLVGLYHPPEGGRFRDEAVLVCGPGPQEYMQTHWAMRKLAALLCREGFHVLRFDYFGTGDSFGASSEGRMGAWRGDIADALTELSDLSGASRQHAVGFRLGAALAATAAVRVERLVLWEPVTNGRRHIDELVAAHGRQFAHCLDMPPLRLDGPEPELVGLPFPAQLRAEIEQISLPSGWACRTALVDIVTTNAGEEADRLAARIGAHVENTSARVHRVEKEATSDGDEPFLLSSAAQRCIAQLLARGRS